MRRIADHEKEIGDFLLDGMLFMNGTDHQEPQPWLGRVVAEANEHPGRLRARGDLAAPTTWPRAPTDGLPTWKGELRSGARANVLMGVASNRVDVKRAGGTRRACPRAAGRAAVRPVPASPRACPARLLELAWREMVRNAAHDSICACSVDEVVDAVLDRYAEARRIADGLADQALAALARSLAEPGPTVVNPSARAARRHRRGRRSRATTSPPAARPCPRSPAPSASPGAWARSPSTPPRCAPSSACCPTAARSTPTPGSRASRVEEDETGIDITIAFGSEERFDVPIASIKQDLYTRLGARPDSIVRIRIDQPPVRRVLARVADVPGFG